MAREESDRSALSVEVPSDLETWLEDRAASLGVDESTVVRQLLAAYRATDDLDDEAVSADVLVGDADVEALVQSAVDERFDDVAADLESKIEDEATGDLADELERVESTLQGDISQVRAAFQQKLEDVRERVIQVKRETDGKAAAGHTHEELDELEADLSALEGAVEDLRSDFSDAVDDFEARLDGTEGHVDDVEDRLESFEEKLRTVAWIVSDLREAHENGATTDGTVQRLKQRAAEEGVDRAQCQSCGKTVKVSLLTEPVCPHCDATVSSVEAARGFFGLPRLVVAKQLEAGPEDGEDAPEAARGG